MKKKIFLFLLLIFNSGYASAIPGLVWVTTIPSTSGNSTTQMTAPLPAAVLSGNTLVCGWNNAAGISPSSFTDNNSNVYTLATSNDDGNQRLHVYYKENITNAPTKLIVSYGSSTAFINGHCWQLYNVAQSSSLDGFGQGRAAATTLQLNTGAGGTSLVTTSDGDIILVVGIQDSVSTKITSWTKHASYTMSSNDYENSIAGEYLIQAVHGTIDNTTTLLTQNPSHNYIIIAVAFKAAVAGTAPPNTINISALHHQAVNLDGIGASEVEGFPCIDGANLLYGAFIGVSADALTSITDTAGNTWIATGTSIFNGGSGNVRAFYAHATTGAFSCISNNIITLNFSGPGAVPGDTIWLYSIRNVTTAVPLDSAGCVASCTATGTGLGTSIPSTASLTTLGGNELVISTLGVTSNTVTNSNNTFISVIYVGETSPSPADENNGQAIAISSISTTYNFSWTTDAAAGTWASRIDAFIGTTNSSSTAKRNTMMTFGRGQ